MPAKSADEQFPERIPLVVEVRDSTVSRNYLIGRPWVDATLKDALSVADVVFVPWETFRDIEQPVFPTGTIELFQSLQDSDVASLTTEIAVPDELYSEVALHADIIFLPTLLVGSVVVPVAVNLISEWLKKRLLERATDADVKFEMIVEEPNGATKSVRYEGPVAAFESLVNAQLRQADAIVLPDSERREEPPNPRLNKADDPRDPQ
jgi:hypothetical protein